VKWASALGTRVLLCNDAAISGYAPSGLIYWHSCVFCQMGLREISQRAGFSGRHEGLSEAIRVL
jgi:hypothetical protein